MSRKMGKLEEEKRRIVESNEELESKFRITLHQLEKQSEAMLALRNEKLEIEKCLTVLKHDLRTLNRKLEQEGEARMNSEATLSELKSKFEGERSRLANQLSLANEKYSSLDKQIAILSEKLKAESEAVTREANAGAELKHLLAANEAAMGELKAKLELERVKDRELETLKDQLGASMAKVKELDATILCLRGELKDHKIRHQQSPHLYHVSNFLFFCFIIILYHKWRNFIQNLDKNAVTEATLDVSTTFVFRHSWQLCTLPTLTFPLQLNRTTTLTSMIATIIIRAIIRVTTTTKWAPSLPLLMGWTPTPPMSTLMTSTVSA